MKIPQILTLIPLHHLFKIPFLHYVHTPLLCNFVADKSITNLLTLILI